MTDIPTFEPGSASELAWARAVLREKNQWRSVASGDAVLAMARRIVQEAEAPSHRQTPPLLPVAGNRQ